MVNSKHLSNKHLLCPYPRDTVTSKIKNNLGPRQHQPNMQGVFVQRVVCGCICELRHVFLHAPNSGMCYCVAPLVYACVFACDLTRVTSMLVARMPAMLGTQIFAL